MVPAILNGTRESGETRVADATILVVDDNAALLRSVDRLLRMEGFTVWMASDARDALIQLEAAEQLPDLIISDIAMPGMDGFEFYRAVRKRKEWVRIPFVFLTARDQSEDLQTGYALGADDYLIKPLNQDRLLMIANSKIERSRELMRYIDQQQQALGVVQRELSMMVAHELRTPLVSITMISDMLSRELEQMETSQVQEMLAMMQSGSVRMHRLVEQMVLYVQLQSGALENEIHELNREIQVDKLLHAVLQKVHKWEYRPRDVPVELDIEEPDTVIVGEEMALTHVCAEVLFNAIVFARPETPVTVQQRTEDHTLVITITDQGPGIPAPAQARVFEPFFQHNRDYYEQQGIGIGLTLARSIAELYGGSVTLESQPDAGTRVTLWLPLIVRVDGR